MLSIIIPLYGKSRDILLARLFTNLEAQTFKDFEVTITEQMHPIEGYHTGFGAKVRHHHILTPINGDEFDEFNKSWVMNVGAKTASSDNLVFLDMDMGFGPDYLQKIDEFRQHLNYGTCWSEIEYEAGRDMHPRTITPEQCHTSGGCFYVNRQFYWEVGAMNENYIGYGGEDNDLWVRVNRVMGPHDKDNIPALSYHLFHGYHHNSPPNPRRHYILNYTMQHTNLIVQKLRNVDLGSELGPSYFSYDDLPPLKDPSDLGRWVFRVN